MAHRRT